MSQIQQDMLNSLQLVFQSMNNVLKQHGIEMYIYKVKLYMKESQEHVQLDEDCPDASLCIDYIVRIKCNDADKCMKLKENLRQNH